MRTSTRQTLLLDIPDLSDYNPVPSRADGPSHRPEKDARSFMRELFDYAWTRPLHIET
jgi:hypothetical protein